MKRPRLDGAGPGENKHNSLDIEQCPQSTPSLPPNQERPVSLSTEMDAASDLCPPRTIEKAGIDWLTCTTAGGIGLVRAQTFKDSTYQPVDHGGRLLWLLPVFYGPVRPETLADLVAWAPDDPARWWRRTGCGAVLGFGNVQRARAVVWDFGRLDDEPAPVPTLTLHPTPKAYVLAGFEGAVILDWRHGLSEIEGVQRLVCPDLDFAERVERELKRNRAALPAILVDNKAEAA